jgi:hypothetical protein
LSDHRNILFNLEGFVPERLVRNSGGIKWDFFREDPKGRLKQGLEMNMIDEVRSGLAILFVQLALILAYEGNYSVTPVKTSNYPLSGHLISSPVEKKWDGYLIGALQNGNLNACNSMKRLRGYTEMR